MAIKSLQGRRNFAKGLQNAKIVTHFQSCTTLLTFPFHVMHLEPKSIIWFCWRTINII